MTTASATVCQRTTRLSPRRSSGSKSNAMTAIGTVPVSVSKAEVSAGRHLDCHPVGRPAVSGRTSSRTSRWGTGALPPAGGGEERRVLGDSPFPIPAPGPWGDGPGVGAHEAGTHTCRNAKPPVAPPFGSTCSAPSRCAPTAAPAVPLGGRHAPALFAQLVLARRPRSREAIAADLWPEADATSAGCCGRRSGSSATACSGPASTPPSILDIRPESIGIRPEARIEVDVVDVRALPRRRRVRRRAGHRAVPRRPRRVPRTRLLRDRAGTPRRSLRGRPGDRRPASARRRATSPARAGPPRRPSSETRSARRRTRSSSWSSDRPVRARRSSGSTGACRSSSPGSSASRRSPRRTPPTGRPCATSSSGRWSRSPSSKPELRPALVAVGS